MAQEFDASNIICPCCKALVEEGTDKAEDRKNFVCPECGKTFHTIIRDAVDIWEGPHV